MANSTYGGMLTAAKTAIDGLSLGATCVIRRLPTAQESLDTLPLIVVSPSDTPEEYERLAFNGPFTFSPTVQVVIIAANNGDYSTDLVTRLDWRQSIANALSDLDIGLSSSITYNAPLDRSMINLNYDYLSLGWKAELWQ